MKQPYSPQIRDGQDRLYMGYAPRSKLLPIRADTVGIKLTCHTSLLNPVHVPSSRVKA